MNNEVGGKQIKAVLKIEIYWTYWWTLETNRQVDLQRDRQRDRQTDRRTDGWTDNREGIMNTLADATKLINYHHSSLAPDHQDRIGGLHGSRLISWKLGITMRTKYILPPRYERIELDPGIIGEDLSRIFQPCRQDENVSFC